MSLCLTPAIERITARVTNRSESLFAADLASHDGKLSEVVRGARVLVAGGAGSIGAATIFELIGREPASITVLDPNENNLAELVRTIRSHRPAYRGQLSVAPLDYGSQLARRRLAMEPPFDLVLAFAALKHVRSERDLVSVLRMLEVNLLGADRFLASLRSYGHGARGVFMVSTDKAAAPVSLMGASKRVMELLLWAHSEANAPASLCDLGVAAPLARTTSARFANVAFSDGSLGWSFLQRLAKEQPLALPGDVRRYLLSPREAGQFCLLAAALGPNASVLVPNLEPAKDAVSFKALAEATLAAHGYEPAYYDSEEEARDAVEADMAHGRYPVLVTTSDTSGEKELEVFVGAGEDAQDCGFTSARAVLRSNVLPSGLPELLHLIDDGCHRGSTIEKAELARAIAALVPEFEHRDTGKSLDDKM
ncbi:MAG: NAD-dependent epimerase/dehydratase family protein [Myxococcales bacterium]|nr:NAD-dependent epimerase/dehydratase family protein [Myxococcales bacterium]